MEHIKRVLSYVRRAVDDYEMIREGDKIAVGVSAGKDSLTLLCAMAELRRFYPKQFELCAITVDMGFEGADFSQIAALCEQLGVPARIEPFTKAQLLEADEILFISTTGLMCRCTNVDGKGVGGKDPAILERFAKAYRDRILRETE